MRPRALHKTASIFLRNLAPTITKQEVEAVSAHREKTKVEASHGEKVVMEERDVIRNSLGILGKAIREREGSLVGELYHCSYLNCKGHNYIPYCPI